MRKLKNISFSVIQAFIFYVEPGRFKFKAEPFPKIIEQKEYNLLTKSKILEFTKTEQNEYIDILEMIKEIFFRITSTKLYNSIIKEKHIFIAAKHLVKNITHPS